MGNVEARADPRGADDALGREVSVEAQRLDAAELRRRKLQRPLSYFVHRHAGRPAVIIGGGMSQPEQMRRVPPVGHAVYFSCNVHGVKYYPCDYAVCLDPIERDMRKYTAPVITSKMFGEIRIFYQRATQTGMVAAYVAAAMGCSPVLLVGMDCWVGGTYHDNPKAASSGNSITTKQHLQRWRDFRPVLLGHDVRALGGPLVDAGLFPLHDAAAPAAPPIGAEIWLRDVGGSVVEIVKDGARWPPVSYERGQLYEVHPNHAARMVQKREARLVGEIGKRPELAALCAAPRLD